MPPPYPAPDDKWLLAPFKFTADYVTINIRRSVERGLFTAQSFTS